jgi:hypothetical protein
VSGLIRCPHIAEKRMHAPPPSHPGFYGLRAILSRPLRVTTYVCGEDSYVAPRRAIKLHSAVMQLMKEVIRIATAKNVRRSSICPASRRRLQGLTHFRVFKHVR